MSYNCDTISIRDDTDPNTLYQSPPAMRASNYRLCSDHRYTVYIYISMALTHTVCRSPLRCCWMGQLLFCAHSMSAVIIVVVTGILSEGKTNTNQMTLASTFSKWIKKLKLLSSRYSKRWWGNEHVWEGSIWSGLFTRANVLIDWICQTSSFINRFLSKKVCLAFKQLYK